MIDMDRVERHNLDRLLNAGRWDVGRYKVDVAAEHLERTAAYPFHELVALPLSLRDSRAYRSLADCDVILACADKPIARDLINHLAVCHLIPAIEAGVALRSREGHLHKGHVVSQVVTPDSRCLRCTRQYTTDQLSPGIRRSLRRPRVHPKSTRTSTAEYCQHFPSQPNGFITTTGPIYKVIAWPDMVASRVSTTF